ncbi:MAG TPA: PAS domain S-box protein, partial [Salinimicrobium sp.]|nr:PAS domain S-box protein [Salinimicrobium sp.]
MSTISDELQEFEEKESRARVFAKSFIENIPQALLVLDYELRIVAGNASFYNFFDLNKKEVENLPLLEIRNNYFSDLQDISEKLSASNGKITELEIFLGTPEVLQENYFVNASLLNKNSREEKLILLSFRNSTEKDTVREQKNYVRKLKEITAQAPAMICTLKGPNHVFEIANEKYFQLVGHRNIIGKPVREVLPEVENQGFIKILDDVYTSGKPFIGKELPIELHMGQGKIQNSFLDFVYQPTLDIAGKVDGIFVHAIDVTEQVMARKKVEENEIYLQNLIDTVPSMIWIGDATGQSTYLNKNWFEYTGQEKEEAIGMGWLDAIHPDEREETSKICGDAIRKEKDFMVTFRLRDKNGNYRWVVNRGKSKFDLDGKYQGMIGTVVDVHEEKIKEQLIREKEHHIRSIVQEATVATALYIGPEMKIELANDAMINLWGKDRSIIGKDLESALPELQGQPFLGLLRDVYETGEIYWGKEDKVDLFRNNELQTGFYNFTYKPLRNENGEVYGILNMAINVTEIVQSKLLLKESESHFRQMADLMPDKVANTDAEGNPIYFNQNWLDYTGLTSEELKVLGWTQFIHPEDKKKFKSRWEESLISGNAFEMELRCLNKSGKYKWHLSRAAAVRKEDGEIKMWIGTNTEIQKIKEEEKRKEDFLKMVSHELKTPITSIKGYVQLLLSLLENGKETSDLKLPLKPSLERIDHQVKRLTRLISEMLDITRIEENKLELQKEKFSINDLVNETVQDINYTNTQHKIIVSHDFKCDVCADRDRIGQALINFIT